ncbi:hypothetical protein Tco_0743139 [Tanacetum coccineum]
MCPRPFGVFYEGRCEKKRFMGSSKFHKFCDGTLKDVQKKLMIMLRLNQVDRVLKESRHMRILEVYVGGRPRTEDIRLFLRPE